MPRFNDMFLRTGLKKQGSKRANIVYRAISFRYRSTEGLIERRGRLVRHKRRLKKNPCCKRVRTYAGVRGALDARLSGVKLRYSHDGRYRRGDSSSRARTM